MVYIHRLYDAHELTREVPTGHVYTIPVEPRQESEPFPLGAAGEPLRATKILWKSEVGVTLGSIDVEVAGRAEIGYPEFLCEDEDVNFELEVIGSVLVHHAYHWLIMRGYAYAVSFKSLKEFVRGADTEILATFDTDANVESRMQSNTDNADQVVNIENWKPAGHEVLTDQAGKPLTVRRAEPSERRAVVAWIEKEFGSGWASEAECGFNSHVPTVLICVYSRDTFEDPSAHFAGFITYDTRRRGMITACAVHPKLRGKRISVSLVEKALTAMQEAGYKYAFFGGVDKKRSSLLRNLPGIIDIEGSGSSIFGKAVRS
ncbi:GNAT family N-acetyltransferase [Corynebacterium striatum]|uniref:GNAT family N-acetyltransferase n=1 Tax=Corynebacterium striatum TaxID=43770 RepID=UPI001A2C796E|nr:GNAT family N-acetyltransferase [Corynebacterium striatum]HAT1347181.1 GNAT family N-acetyltransferase [Corynebacterium striatum]HAT1477439.1 GNAT family N-acetyltransferase [Corynebacterium striatum]HAT6526672.1 GNAT family N-acetyltransferase [Corynebacterium striatum]HAT6564822.1 GNAT family N-acetyltransferase [Corynebacterium striatum]